MRQLGYFNCDFEKRNTQVLQYLLGALWRFLYAVVCLTFGVNLVNVRYLMVYSCTVAMWLKILFTDTINKKNTTIIIYKITVLKNKQTA